MPLKRVKRQYCSPWWRKKNQRARLWSPLTGGPAQEVLEGGHLHHGGELWLDLFPPPVKDTGSLVGTVVAP